MKARRLGAIVAALCAASMALTGCGSSTGSSATDADDGKLMTVDVFDSPANYAGIQKGWWAKIIKDRFNIRLNIIAPQVSGGGETLFDTRSAAGNLGDIIITNTDNGRLAKLVKSHLIADMTPYLSGMKWLNRYKGSAKALESLAGKKGVWGYASQVASGVKPTQPSEGAEPNAAPYIRWDYYREIGYPAIPDMDSFLNVLKQMQDRARQDTGKKVYALSLFKDWDGAAMNNASSIAGWFGYWAQGSAFAKADGSDKQTVLTKKGIYQKILAWLQKANSMGLVDPDSTTQTWDQLGSKVQDGKVLVSIWRYLGKPRMNTPSNKKKGIGFMIAPLQTMHVYSAGFTPNGIISQAICLGAKAKNKRRLVKFINWLYSPEGVNDSVGYAGGIKGLVWKLNKKGQPEFTHWGYIASNDSSNPNRMTPKGYGTGPWREGVCQLNFTSVNPWSINPDTGEAYSAQLWTTELKRTDPLLEDWSKHMLGAKTDIQYLEKAHKIDVQPGVSFAAPEEDSQISAVRSQINNTIVSASWKSVFAKSKSAFNSEINKMIENGNGLGFPNIQKVDYQVIDDHVALQNKLK